MTCCVRLQDARTRLLQIRRDDALTPLRAALAWVLARALPLATLLLASPAIAATVSGLTINESLPQGSRGSAYSQTITVSGGTAPYTFTLLAPNNLPASLTLSSGGVLSGVISCAGGNGNYKQAIRITDSSPTPIVADFTSNPNQLAFNVTTGPGVCVPLTLAPASLPSPVVGVAYSQAISVTNGIGPYTYAVTTGTLPAGLALNTATGQIAGTPTTAGTYSFTITATDAAFSTGSLAYSGTVVAALTVNPSGLPAVTQGVAYSQAVTATGGAAPYTYALVGSLPAGLTLNTSTGLISGTPSASGTSNFTINATDSVGAFGSRAYSILVNPPLSIAPATLPPTTQGVAYSQTVSASGGTGTVTFSVTTGALPTGLSLNGTTGALTGTPSAAGNFNFTVTATDSVGATGLRAYALTINAPIAVAPASLPAATVGAPYSQGVSATGGTGSLAYSLTAGALPAGLSLNTATGAITGTPSASGSFSFTIAATDSVGASGFTAYSFTVNVVTLTVNPVTLPATTQGLAYNQIMTASGGTGPITFALAGNLPTGLTLNTATGAITGNAAAAGSFDFTITATDSVGSTGNRAYTVVVNATVAVNPASLPAWTAGLAYSQTVSSTGGTGAVTFGVTAGTLPTGLSLNAASGTISGTPTAAGSFNFTVTGTDALGATGARAYGVTINAAPVVGPATLPASTQGVAYSQAVSASGGTGAVTFGVTAGALPTGLSLNPATGAITGTAGAPGAFAFTITATDAVGGTGSQAYSITINAPLTVNPASLPAASAGVAYSQSVSTTGGTGAAAFAITAGSLPTGLSLNAATGAITGTPSAAGTFNFTITATDTVGATGTRAYSVTVSGGILTVNPSALPATTQGLAYSQSVTASGGTGPYTYAVSGALPTGLALNTATGAVTGTASAAGTFSFTVSATDSFGASGSRAYSVVVNAAITVGPASLPNATQGAAYAQPVSATGGTGTLTYSVSAGALPSGVSLSALSGALTGTPSAAGTFNFTIAATDTLGASGSRAYSVVVATPLVVNPPSLPATTQGAAYAQTLSASGGTGAASFSLSAGALPPGLALNGASGAISGTPGASGTFNFTITATDSVGATGTRAYSIVVNAPVVVSPASLPAGSLGVAYGQSVAATGGTGAATFAVSAGALPPGLFLNASSGAISGTPTSSGSFGFTITATDMVGASGAQAYSVAINGAIAVNPASLPASTLGVAYSQSVSASGGSGGYTFGVSAGMLPTGLSLNAATGAITGTPTAAGSFGFTINATDGLGAAGARSYSVVIAPAIAIGPATLPAGVNGSAYNQTLSAAGGTGPSTFAVTAGALPAGLTLNGTTGALSGTPTATGTFNFTITGTDTVGAAGSRAYSVTVNATVAVNPASLPNAVVGTVYSQTVNATGGSGGYTYSVSGGTLPAGVTLNAASGLLSGTPSTASTSNFTITATDGLGASGTRAFSIQAFPAMTVNPSTLPAAGVGTAYAQTISVAGGAGSATFAVTAGSLPAGLALNPANGVLSGTPTVAGTTNFTITATDGLGATAARAYSVSVNAALSLDPPTLPVATTGSAYAQSLSIAGGSGIYTYALSAGTLPPGITLNASTGALAGTPGGAGAFTFSITVTDSVGASATRSYTLTVNAAVAVGPAALPNPVVGAAYSQAVTGSGGTGSYAFTITAGALPPGMSLTTGAATAMRANATVQNTPTVFLSGTPAAAGTFNFTITATDDLGVAGNRAYTVTVVMPTLSLAGAVANGAVGAPYSGAIGIAGGTAPYTYVVASGQLPPGVALDSSTGSLSGVPTAPGTYSFVVAVTDYYGAAGSFTIAIEVAPRPDPSQDPTVRGIHAAQVAAASRYGAAQVGNIASRLQMLHLGHDPCALHFDVSANVEWKRSADADKARPDDVEKAPSERKSGCGRAVAVWAAGNLDFGFLRPSTATARSDFRTDGVTLGADTKLAEGLVVGAALGYGRDQTDADGFGSEARSHAQTIALYGSYRPLKSIFIDAVAGYGTLSYELTRWQSDDRMLLAGDRGGSQWFASLGASAVLHANGIKFAPYARIDHVQSRLDGYTESGNSALRLAYDVTSFAEDTLAAGVYAGLSFRAGSAVVEPGLRVEHRRVRTGSAEQGIAYWDMPAAPTVLRQAGDSDNHTSGALSVMLRFGLAASLGVEYSYTGSSGTYRSESVRAVLRAPF